MTCYLELNEKSIGLAAAGAAILGLSLSDGLLQPAGSLRARREARAAAASAAATLAAASAEQPLPTTAPAFPEPPAATLAAASAEAPLPAAADPAEPEPAPAAPAEPQPMDPAAEDALLSLLGA